MGTHDDANATHTATHCYTLQHVAAHCSTNMGARDDAKRYTHCNALQQTATHCNTLQHKYGYTWWC